MSMNHEEQTIIEKLQAQRANVRPSRALLERILLQLSPPSAPQRFSFWWLASLRSGLRIAIPAGVAVLVGIIFLQMQRDPTPISHVQVRQEQAVSITSLATEEEALEQTFEQQESFFEDELLMEEVTLSDF